METIRALGATDAILIGVILIGLLFALLISILWTLMPFAIFGTKDLLRQLIREQRRTNELLMAEAKRRSMKESYMLGDDDLRATR